MSLLSLDRDTPLWCSYLSLMLSHKTLDLLAKAKAHWNLGEMEFLIRAFNIASFLIHNLCYRSHTTSLGKVPRMNPSLPFVLNEFNMFWLQPRQFLWFRRIETKHSHGWSLVPSVYALVATRGWSIKLVWVLGHFSPDWEPSLTKISEASAMVDKLW